jgi:hypothetical protein
MINRYTITSQGLGCLYIYDTVEKKTVGNQRLRTILTTVGNQPLRTILVVYFLQGFSMIVL